MDHNNFEKTISPQRFGRYLVSCKGNTKKAMTLYRLNLKLSQEFFTVISCFEIALRNSIDNHYIAVYGIDWLNNSCVKNGIFDNSQCRYTRDTIQDSISKLSKNNSYNHNKLVAELGFGFWRYMFAQNQYNFAGRTLLRIFVKKPISTPKIQYNQTYIFNKLAQINEFRNRIAHHEPVCFQVG